MLHGSESAATRDDLHCVPNWIGKLVGRNRADGRLASW